VDIDINFFHVLIGVYPQSLSLILRCVQGNAIVIILSLLFIRCKTRIEW